MKLLYCEIIGFGKLKNMRVDLQDGLNVFLHENGWGKTTFCAFIKDMLYGIGEKRTKSIAENDRIKYEPWSANTFGGALGFEHGGKRYRIERTFGKTPSQDTSRVYDEQSRMLSYDFASYGDSIGEALFGLGKEGFERAVFFGDEQLTPTAIDGDLKNVLCRAITNSQGEDVDGAIERIEAAERALKAKRRPAQGLIDETEESILCLREKRRSLEEKLLSAPSLENEIQQLDATVSALNQKIERCTTELAKRGENSDMAVGQALKGQLTAQLEEAQTQLRSLTAFFNGVEPNRIPLQTIQAQTEEYTQRKRTEEELKEKADAQAKQTNEKRSLIERKTELERSLEHYRLAMQEKGEDMPTQTKSPKGKIAGLILFALTVCLFVVGALFLKSNPTVSTLLFIIGTLLLFISVAIAKKTKEKGAGTRRNTNSALQTAYLETQNRLCECEEQLYSLSDTDEEVLQAYSQTKRAREQIEQSLRSYFSAFSFGEIYDFRLALQTLSEKVSAYENLQCVIDEKSSALRALPKENEMGPASVGYTPAQSLKETLFSLHREKEELLKQKHALQSAYDELLFCKTEADELTEEETLLMEKHEQFTRRYAHLQTAKTLLIQAKNNLADKYLTPVANACKSYLSAFGEKSFDVCFDGRGAPVLKDSGFYRLPDFYSQGDRRLIDFCIRLSVIESVYQNAPIPLIFDDPFAEFDDKNFQIAKQFLLSLAKKRQILYFTCSQSRAL